MENSMRAMTRKLLISSMTVVTMTMVAGCFHNADDCTKTQTCPTTATDGGSGGSGGTGGTGGTPDECVPHVATGPVGDSCGVFVSSSKGNDSNDGSKDR